MKQQRTCIACRRTAGKGVLVRLVLKENRVLLDEKQKLSGRGAYVHAAFDCLKKVRAAEKWARAFRVRGDQVDNGSVQEVFDKLVEISGSSVTDVEWKAGGDTARISPGRGKQAQRMRL